VNFIVKNYSEVNIFGIDLLLFNKPFKAGFVLINPSEPLNKMGSSFSSFTLDIDIMGDFALENKIKNNKKALLLFFKNPDDKHVCFLLSLRP
jgi:hypothetical protein